MFLCWISDATQHITGTIVATRTSAVIVGIVPLRTLLLREVLIFFLFPKAIYDMHLNAVWWPVLVGVAVFAVLIFALFFTGDRSLLVSKSKKHKKSKRSATATKLAGNKISLLAFKRCL